MKTVLYVAGEGLPFIKSGGLADVIGSLPKYLDKKEYKVLVMMPLYKKIIDKHPEVKHITDFEVHSGIINKTAGLYHCASEETDYYFIRQDEYFYRDGMYGYVDDGERFAFFDKAVLEALNHIKDKIDIIHCHDWHTGMIACLCKCEYTGEKYKHIKHVFTIHNLAFQGNYPKDVLQCFNNADKYYNDGNIAFDGGISFMKAALKYSDKITTVSNSYAQEICTSEYGERMDQVLRERSNDLWGIVNGIDIASWNPETDKDISHNYSLKSLANKKKCKRELQQRLGLRVADDVLLVGLVSRLTWQKGVSIILEKLSQIMNQDLQLIILGTGDNYIENQFKRIESDYPHRAVFYCGYDEKLSHQMYAGLDLFLMPSLFEPCGISQLISMRYGTIPLVREVGGLRDTVIPYNEYDKTGTGFSFKNFNSDDLFLVLRYAMNIYYYDKESWKKLMANAMKADVSWDASAKLYHQLYSQL